MNEQINLMNGYMKNFELGVSEAAKTLAIHPMERDVERKWSSTKQMKETHNLQSRGTSLRM